MSAKRHRPSYAPAGGLARLDNTSSIENDGSAVSITYNVPLWTAGMVVLVVGLDPSGLPVTLARLTTSSADGQDVARGTATAAYRLELRSATGELLDRYGPKDV